MAVSPHPSVKPSQPKRPPRIEHKAEHAEGSGQSGVPYGSSHTLKVHDPNSSEFAHHFSDFAKAGD